MARDGRTKAMEKRKMREEPGLVECYYCSKPVKSSAMRCPHCGKLYSSGKRAAAAIVASMVLAAAVLGYYMLPGSPGYNGASGAPMVLATSPNGDAVLTTAYITVQFDREMNRTSVEEAFSVAPTLPGTFSWGGATLTFVPAQPMAAGTMYSVIIQDFATDLSGNSLDNGFTWHFTTAQDSASGLRSIGTGSEQFWDRTTSHPAWVAAAVQTKPLLILTHSTGCAPCDAMMAICEPLSVEYAGQFAYYNITSGTDEPEATDCFAAYDPDGEPHYVPLTTIVTKGPDGSILWHSWEGAFDEAMLVSWIDDAISYHSLYG